MDVLAPAMAASGASFFEAMTALALLHFARRKADVAVLEVGIGGALDATNVVDPVLSLVVSVGLDHTDVLGPTIAHIARDKAGIARKGRPLVIGARGEARAVLVAEAERRGARPLVLGIDGRYRADELRADSSRFSFWSSIDGFAGNHLELGLPGRHQIANAACALVGLGALEIFPRDRIAAGIRPGLARLRWPGRLDRLAPWLLVDGAHNAAGARVLADHLQRFESHRRLVAVVGMVAGKRPRSFARALHPAISAAVVTQPPSERAVPAARLAAELERAGLACEVAPEPAHALARARAAAGRDGLVVVCGSLYLVGAIFRLLSRRPVEQI
jgi:dihydrofolate synthase/folylpolyglutamate synthase